MSIASQLQAYENGLTDAYNMVSQRGGTMPVHKNMSSLASAIATIPAGTIGIPREVVSGVFQMPSSSFVFSLPSEVTTISGKSLDYAFVGCTGLTGVDLSSVTTITGYQCMNSAFSGCTNLVSVDLSSLITVSGGMGILYKAFKDCTGLTSVTFDSLSTVSSTAFLETFSGCTSLTSLYFPSLTPNSFSSANAFAEILYGVTGCTLHFPDGMQSTIQGLNAYPDFGGTNTTVLFDL